MGYILSKKVLYQVSRDLREQDTKIVLTHGTFDLLHAGHISFLNESKRLGDCLIVGVESDARVRKYKQSKIKRPIISLEQRMGMVTGLQCVDFVFAIKGGWGNTNSFYAQIYTNISPSVLTFGESYGSTIIKLKRQMKGIEFCQLKKVSSGKGRIQSTTNIINKIIES